MWRRRPLGWEPRTGQHAADFRLTLDKKGNRGEQLMLLANMEWYQSLPTIGMSLCFLGPVDFDLNMATDNSQYPMAAYTRLAESERTRGNTTTPKQRSAWIERCS